MSGYFPYGFVYPKGFQYSETNPDPMIEKVRLRIEFLNQSISYSSVDDYIFAAALDLFQSHTEYEKEVFWDGIMDRLNPAQLARIVDAISGQVVGAMPRLEFPNSIALFDCRFISTKEWEHIRRYSIGGSEAATVLGLSHFQTPRSLYFEKKAPVPDERSLGSQHILDYGHYLEPHIVHSIASTIGAVLYPEHRMFAHKDYPFITCNPDGILMFSDGHLALFEAKTAYRMKRDDWKMGIPDYYEPQPRQYLEVLNDPRLVGGYIGVCLGGDPMDRICHDYLRDPAKGAAQIQTVVDYWETYIIPGVLPPLSGNFKLDMEAVYKYDPTNYHDKPSAETLPSTAEALFEEYFRIQEERKSLSKLCYESATKEAELDVMLRAAIPAELTVCTKPNSLSYILRIKETVSTVLDTTAAAQHIPASLMATMNNIAAITKDAGLSFTTPKVSVKTVKSKKGVA